MDDVLFSPDAQRHILRCRRELSSNFSETCVTSKRWTAPECQCAHASRLTSEAVSRLTAALVRLLFDGCAGSMSDAQRMIRDFAVNLAKAPNRPQKARFVDDVDAHTPRSAFLAPVQIGGNAGRHLKRVMLSDLSRATLGRVEIEAMRTEFLFFTARILGALNVVQAAR